MSERGCSPLYIVKGENSGMKSSVPNLARMRSRRNGPWYKLMEVAKLGLGSARTRGYATFSSGYAQTQDIARGFKMSTFNQNLRFWMHIMERIIARNKWLE